MKSISIATVPAGVYLIVNIEGHPKGLALRGEYARAKLAALREFGYPELTAVEVEAQIDLIVGNLKLTDKESALPLDVIGQIIAPEILGDYEAK